MDVKVFKAREGSHISDDDAQKIGEYLVGAFGEHRIRPVDFVLSATSKKSPLHGYLEWDDTRAGKLWRLEESRKILGALMVVQTSSGGEERVTRALHNVVLTGREEAASERAYVWADVVWRTPDLKQQVLRAAAAEADRAASRLDQYEDLAIEASSLREVASSLRERVTA